MTGELEPRVPGNPAELFDQDNAEVAAVDEPQPDVIVPDAVSPAPEPQDDSRPAEADADLGRPAPEPADAIAAADPAQTFSWLPPGVTVIPVAPAPVVPPQPDPPPAVRPAAPVYEPQPVYEREPEPDLVRWRPPAMAHDTTLSRLDLPPEPVGAPLRREPLPVAAHPERVGPLVRPVPGKRGPAARPASAPRFRGPRLSDRIGFWRRLRSIVELIVVTAVLGALLATVIAFAVGGVVVALQKALG